MTFWLKTSMPPLLKSQPFGERLADRVASFGGSWTFISLFGSVLIVWITINSLAMLGKPFDPYPFILLNLVLSCLAAIQAGDHDEPESAGIQRSFACRK